MHKTTVFILGGGYAGMMAAVRLAGRTRRQSVSITLVNATDCFVERPLLHEVATGKPAKKLPMERLLKGTGVEFRQGWVSAIDPNTDTIVVVGGEKLHYDYLIYALGSRVDRNSVPGVDQYAYTLDPFGPRSTQALITRLAAPEPNQVMVAGSGPTGIEAAAAVAERFPHHKVRIVTANEFAAFADAGVRAHMRRALHNLDVGVMEYAPIARVEEDDVILQNGDVIPADLCIWAGGFRAIPLARESGLLTNRRDQVLVDPALRALSHPNIFVAGDSAAPIHATGAPPRMSLLFGLVTGAHAADSLDLVLQGKEPRPFGFSTYGQSIALGSRDAVGFGTFPNDRRLGPMMTGLVAVSVRTFFVERLREMIDWERRIPGSFFWLGRGRGVDSTATPYHEAKQTS